MRAVIDTNVLLSGTLWHGPPNTLLDHVRAGTLAFVSSPALLDESANVIGRAKFDPVFLRTETTREQVLAESWRMAEVIEAPSLAEPVCRDPDDDELLALAIAARVDLIVTGDDDLLALQVFKGIPIVAPAEAIALIAATILGT